MDEIDGQDNTPARCPHKAGQAVKIGWHESGCSPGRQGRSRGIAPSNLTIGRNASEPQNTRTK